MKTVMCSHFDALTSHFEKYFSEEMEKYNWIRNPFVDNANAPQGLHLWKLNNSLILLLISL